MSPRNPTWPSRARHACASLRCETRSRTQAAGIRPMRPDARAPHTPQNARVARVIEQRQQPSSPVSQQAAAAAPRWLARLLPDRQTARAAHKWLCPRPELTDDRTNSKRCGAMRCDARSSSSWRACGRAAGARPGFFSERGCASRVFAVPPHQVENRGGSNGSLC